jgi:hypothetical protein
MNAVRINNPGPIPQAAGVVGALALQPTGLGGIAVGQSPPTGGGTPSMSLSQAATAISVTVGGDDLWPDTKDGQGGGTGKNASSNCMTAAEHNASRGSGKDPQPGAPPFCVPCVWNGFIAQIV